MYNTKCSGENEILRGIFRVLFRFPLRIVSRNFLSSVMGKGMVQKLPSVAAFSPTAVKYGEKCNIASKDFCQDIYIHINIYLYLCMFWLL